VSAPAGAWVGGLYVWVHQAPAEFHTRPAEETFVDALPLLLVLSDALPRNRMLPGVFLGDCAMK
jgi:hypothetical protein